MDPRAAGHTEDGYAVAAMAAVFADPPHGVVPDRLGADPGQLGATSDSIETLYAAFGRNGHTLSGDKDDVWRDEEKFTSELDINTDPL